MANLVEWQEEIGRLTAEEVKRYKDALEVLESWPFLKKEFKDIGLFSITRALTVFGAQESE